MLTSTSLAAADKIISLEGGYVNSPMDSGGATKYGITQRTWDSYAPNHEPTLRGIHIKDLPIEAARRFWARKYVVQGFDGPDTRFLPLFSAAGLMGDGTALRGFRRFLSTKVLPKYPSLSPPAGIIAQGTGPLSADEREWLSASFGNGGVQFFTNLFVLRDILAWCREDLNALKAGKPSPGSASLVYALGWITRRFTPAYTEFIPMPLKVALGKWALASILKLRAEAGPNLVEPRAYGGTKVSTLLTPKSSNWLWRDRELQQLVGFG